MVFTSHLFLFYFLPLTLLLYYVFPHQGRSAWLVVASYLFYGWANPPWALLMFLSTLVDYLCGVVLVRLSGIPDEGGHPPLLPRGQPRSRGQRAAVAASIVSNLGLLAYFKYSGFAVENLNHLAQVLGLGDHALPTLRVVLPVGISFYTFQSMSYAIDVYRGDARAMRSLADFLCFEAFYPNLVAGPIVRYAAIEQQIRSRTHSWEKFARGVAFFSCGMAKKILLANPLGQVVEAAFGSPTLHWYDAWYGIISYCFQIYFDFSGYSDMAVGLALMIGFTLMKNFDSPFQSESITDSWRRWHISLSTWLRDYLYIPLGGSRRGALRSYLNLIIVMLLGGLWHGASWNFVIFGGLHGVLLAYERAWGRTFYAALPRFGRVAMTFLLVSICFVFFRAETFPKALGYLRLMLGLTPTSALTAVRQELLYAPYQALVFVVAGLLVWSAPQTWEFTKRLSPARASFCLVLLGISVMFMWTQATNPFLYFRF